MSASTTLTARIAADTAGFRRGMADANRSLSTLSRTASSLRNMAVTIGVSVVGMKALQALKEGVTLAAEYADTASATGQIFGKSSDEILKWADANNEAFMQTETQVLETLNRTKGFFAGAGIPDYKSTKMAKNMTALSADLSSFYGGSVADASAAIVSGLSGESEPLRKYGVFLTDAKIKQEAFNLGLYEGKGALSDAARQQATYNVIMRETATAQGDAQRTSESFNNQMRRFSVNTSELKTKFGEAFIPLGEKYLPKINKALEDFKGNDKFFDDLSTKLLDIGDAIENKVLPGFRDAAAEVRKGFGDTDFSGIKDAFSGINWDSIGSAVKGIGKAIEIVGGGAKIFVDAFSRMPPGLQETAVTVAGIAGAWKILSRNPVLKIGVDLVKGALSGVGQYISAKFPKFPSKITASLPDRNTMRVTISGQPIKVVGSTSVVGGTTGKAGTKEAPVAGGLGKAGVAALAASVVSLVLPSVLEQLKVSPEAQKWIEGATNVAGKAATGAWLGSYIFPPFGTIAGGIVGALSGLMDLVPKTDKLRVDVDTSVTQSNAAYGLASGAAVAAAKAQGAAIRAVNDSEKKLESAKADLAAATARGDTKAMEDAKKRVAEAKRELKRAQVQEKAIREHEDRMAKLAREALSQRINVQGDKTRLINRNLELETKYRKDGDASLRTAIYWNEVAIRAIKNGLSQGEGDIVLKPGYGANAPSGYGGVTVQMNDGRLADYVDVTVGGERARTVMTHNRRYGYV